MYPFFFSFFFFFVISITAEYLPYATHGTTSFFLFYFYSKNSNLVAMVVLPIYRRYVCKICTKRRYCLLDIWRRHMYIRLVPMRMMGSRTHARTRAIFSRRGFFCLFWQMWWSHVCMRGGGGGGGRRGMMMMMMMMFSTFLSQVVGPMWLRNKRVRLLSCNQVHVYNPVQLHLMHPESLLESIFDGKLMPSPRPPFSLRRGCREGRLIIQNSDIHVPKRTNK